ncbi:MAG: hypothetical protein U1F54_11295 [Burkholderiales bacterium]
MAGEVTGIDHPTTIGAGTLVTLTAQVAPGKPGVAGVRWTYTEPGGVPQPLGTGGVVRYVPPTKLAGKTIKITAKNKGTPAFAVDIPVADVAVALPAGRVKCDLAAGWSKNLLYHAVSIDGGDPFLVGRRLRYPHKDPETKKTTTYRGLGLNARDAQFVYRPADYPSYKNWAEVFACSTEVEGRGAFEAVNTYDQVNFTFGLIQFAAHTYGQNFHAYLRAAFKQFPTQAERYFPELRLHKNDTDFEGLDAPTGQWIRLTSAADPRNLELRRFIKAVDDEVTANEVKFAGRLMHWARAEPGMRLLMVDMAVERARKNCREFAIELDGQGIAVCALVFDIRLQGRGGKNASARIKKALKSKTPFDSLLLIRNKQQKKRVDDVEAAIRKRFAGSTIKYDAGTGDLK